MTFGEFCNISIFIEKEKKMKEKKKGLHGLGLAHNVGILSARIRPKSKKNPLEFGHFASGTSIYLKNY
jgi:hypothetical protein